MKRWLVLIYFLKIDLSKEKCGRFYLLKIDLDNEIGGWLNSSVADWFEYYAR